MKWQGRSSTPPRPLLPPPGHSLPSRTPLLARAGPPPAPRCGGGARRHDSIDARRRPLAAPAWAAQSVHDVARPRERTRRVVPHPPPRRPPLANDPGLARPQSHGVLYHHPRRPPLGRHQAAQVVRRRRIQYFQGVLGGGEDAPPERDANGVARDARRRGARAHDVAAVRRGARGGAGVGAAGDGAPPPPRGGDGARQVVRGDERGGAGEGPRAPSPHPVVPPPRAPRTPLVARLVRRARPRRRVGAPPPLGPPRRRRRHVARRHRRQVGRAPADAQRRVDLPLDQPRARCAPGARTRGRRTRRTTRSTRRARASSTTRRPSASRRGATIGPSAAPPARRCEA